MDTYGRYRLQFEPAYGDVNPSVTMELSGEADLDQMVSLFDSFLKANGYIYDGELQITERPGREAYESPYNYHTAAGSQGTDFIPFNLGTSVIYGGAGADTISFAGAAQPAVEFGSKSWNDVISFG
jgi:hypothetical protein